jgi:hypothetical protein
MESYSFLSKKVHSLFEGFFLLLLLLFFFYFFMVVML